jgi:hypothetical protein
MHSIGKVVRIAAVTALVASVGIGATPATAVAPGTLTVTPNVDLVDFQRVELTGEGLEPGLHEWYQCRGGAVDDSDCDGYNADFIDVGDDGTTRQVVYVDARIHLPDGTAVDCRTDPAGCVLGVGFMVEAGRWPTVPLNFDPAAPLLPEVTATVDPAQDLEDGQIVTVRGEHLSFREEAFAYLCADGTDMVGRRCDLDQLARAVPDQQGRVTLALEVRAAFTTPHGVKVDCLAPGTTCSVQLGWGFDPPPDRQARVPVSFAPRPPGPTTTTTTVLPSPPPLGPPPPATAIPGQATFTG